MPALARKGIPKNMPRKRLLLQDYGAVLKRPKNLVISQGMRVVNYTAGGCLKLTEHQ